MKAKAYGAWYVWNQQDSGRWTCRRTDWIGRPLDSFIGVGATQDEAFADLQRQREALPIALPTADQLPSVHRIP